MPNKDHVAEACTQITEGYNDGFNTHLENGSFGSVPQRPWTTQCLSTMPLADCCPDTSGFARNLDPWAYNPRDDFTLCRPLDARYGNRSVGWAESAH
jgi:hypothetical protein